MLLAFNYNAIIRPRFEILRKRGMKNLKVDEICPLTDEEYCAKFEVPLDELREKVAEKRPTTERDILWNYVPGL